jgi:hypothetical protein
MEQNEDITWLMNSLSSIPSPPEPLLPSKIIIISTNKHQIQLTQSSLTLKYCFSLFQTHKIPPIQKSSGSAPQGHRKSFRQSYESYEQAQLCLHIFIFLLNQCWGYHQTAVTTGADLDEKVFKQQMEQYLRRNLDPDHNPIDFMISIMHSFLYPRAASTSAPQAISSPATDSDEEFERAAKALLMLSPKTGTAPPSDDTISVTTSPESSGSAKEVSPLAQRILEILSINRRLKAHELANELNVSKPEVNQCLYRVLQTQVTQHSDHSWSLVGIHLPPTASQQQRNQRKRAGDDYQMISTSQSSLQNQIESYLQTSAPCDAQTLRRALSFQRVKPINQTLYDMLRTGRVLKNEGQPPLWSLSSVSS